jgi:Family of unknown function (DUF6328)
MSTIHRESLEEAATHVGGEARMLLPGVQTILGFQLMAVFNQRFEQFSRGEQIAHFAAFLLVALTMGLLMAPAAYHRQAEPSVVSQRFVTLSSVLLALSMIPFTAGICLDTYLVGKIILREAVPAAAAAGAMLVVLTGLWFVLPAAARLHHRS